MMSIKTDTRAGFTLVELLVVIAIIGVMMGLLLPAVQSARESARRAKCANNALQLGLALHQYEFANEAFPSGTTEEQGPIRHVRSGNHVSWTVRILPYIEQRNVLANFDVDLGAYADENLAARKQFIPTFQCPSSPFNDVRLDNGPGAVFSIPVSHYAGCSNDTESPIETDNVGVLFLNSRVRFADLLDGSSQTILIGEYPFDKWVFGWASGTRSTLRNATGISPWNLVRSSEQAQPNPLHVGGFGSFHPGGANFTFADGSVHFMSQSVNPKLLLQLGNRADGELLEENGQVW